MLFASIYKRSSARMRDSSWCIPSVLASISDLESVHRPRVELTKAIEKNASRYEHLRPH